MLRRDLPVELRDRPFTVAEALALGVTRRTLDNPALRRPFTGVRVPEGVPDDLRTLAEAARLVLPPRAALSHATAAALLDLPLPRGLTGRDPVVASVPTSTVVPRIAGMRVVEGLDPGSAWTLGRARVVDPASTWCDLAPHLSATDALVLGDAVVTRLGGTRQVAAVLERRRGRRGVVRLRRLLALTRHPVRSAMETRWRLLVIGAGIPEPLYNAVVLDAAGGWLGTPDGQWPRVKVATEYEGLQHFSDPRQWREDIRRKELMEDEGWRVLRITQDDVLLRPLRAVDRLWCVLAERGLPGLPPRPTASDPAALAA